MKIIYKGIEIDSKIDGKRIEQLMYDEDINKVTKITVRIPRDNYELWSLKGFFGKIIQSENIVDLQKRGFITQLNIQRINVIDKSVDEDTQCLFSLNSTIKSPALTSSPSFLYTVYVKVSSRRVNTLIAISKPQSTPSAFATKYESFRWVSGIK